MRLYLSSFRLGNRPEALLELLGGRTNAAVIGNAMDFADEDKRAQAVEAEHDRLKGIGLIPIEIDLRDYFGRRGELERAIARYDLIWVRGGNAFVLRRAFKRSGADEVIGELLTRDEVVYGGYSAGVDMLTPTLRGTELVDDPYLVPQGYDAPVVWDGLGIVPYAIASHYKSNHPESANVDKSIQYMMEHRIPFKVLRDGEVIVISDGRERLVS